MKRYSGSEKRKRQQRFTARFTGDEAATIRIMADTAGITVSALIRHAVLRIKPPRVARRPTVNHKAVTKLLGQLGKIGSNLNQLAKHANVGKYRNPSIELALRDLAQMRSACLQALGREQEHSLIKDRTNH